MHDIQPKALRGNRDRKNGIATVRAEDLHANDVMIHTSIMKADADPFLESESRPSSKTILHISEVDNVQMFHPTISG